ncbi:MAG: copper-binding protein [Curvibacter sp.]
MRPQLPAALQAAGLCLLLLGAVPATAQVNDHASHHGAGATAAPVPTRAEVRRVDKAAGRITLRHERIEHLDMDPMTMVFQVRDPALLEGLQVGDRVQFTAEEDRGAYVVRSIERQPR